MFIMSKICPKCNKEWPDEFLACPLDGTALVSTPQKPAGFSFGENGAFPPTRDGCIHSLSMRERG